MGGAGCGIGSVPGAKEEGPVADDDDAIGWLDDPACPSGTGIGPGGASSSSSPDELPPLSSSSLSWSRNDTSGRKAVFLSSPISPRRHLFVTVQFLHRRHVKGSPSLSKAAKMAFRSSLAVGSRCRRKRERVFLTFHCDFENMEAGHLSRQYVQRFISPGTNGCAFTFRDAFCGGGRVLYCGSALRFSPLSCCGTMVIEEPRGAVVHSS